MTVSFQDAAIAALVLAWAASWALGAAPRHAAGVVPIAVIAGSPCLVGAFATASLLAWDLGTTESGWRGDWEVMSLMLAWSAGAMAGLVAGCASSIAGRVVIKSLRRA